MDDVVSRAQQAGVEKILLPNINRESIEPMLALCHRYPGYLYPMIGLHPEDVKEDWEQLLSEMETMLQQPGNPFVAVGEVGLDFYWDKTFSEEQKKALDVQIQWAVRYGLPLMIHCRDAHDELLEALAPDYIQGLTLLGGEPFEPKNQEVLLPFVKKVRERFPDKTVWSFSGFTWEELNALNVELIITVNKTVIIIVAIIINIIIDFFI